MKKTKIKTKTRKRKAIKKKENKNIAFLKYFFVFLIFLFGSLFFLKSVEYVNQDKIQSQKVQKKEEVQVSNKEKPLPEFVVEYYSSYFDYLNNRMSEESKFSDESLSEELVTSGFANSIKKLKSNNGLGGANYDPIICAQDYPSDLSKFSFRINEKTAENATVSVCLDPKWKKFDLILKNENGWKIDKIDCEK